MYTIVLANTRREAQAWAREEGISLRKIKFATNSQSIAGRFYDRIVELPSYGKRRDKHAVNAAIKRLLRSVKNLEIEKIEGWVMPQIARPIPPEELRTAALLGDVGTPFSNGGFLPSGLTTVRNDTGEDIKVSPLVQPGQDPVADRREMDLTLSGFTPEQLQELGASEEEQAQFQRLREFEQKVEKDLAGDVEPLTPQQAEAAQEVVAEITESLEEIDNGLTEAGPEPERPKKRGRRTNEQKAFDEAFEAMEAGTGSLNDYEAAKAAVAKRHPDDERLTRTFSTNETPTKAPKLNTPGVAQGAPDLDF